MELCFIGWILHHYYYNLIIFIIWWFFSTTFNCVSECVFAYYCCCRRHIVIVAVDILLLLSIHSNICVYKIITELSMEKKKNQKSETEKKMCWTIIWLVKSVLKIQKTSFKPCVCMSVESIFFMEQRKSSCVLHSSSTKLEFILDLNITMAPIFEASFLFIIAKSSQCQW